MASTLFKGALWAALTLGSLSGVPVAHAQEAIDAALADVSAPQPDSAVLSADEIDALMAPVALYPDTLLAQIFMASTYPLDVVKAGRFVEANAQTPEKDRATAAQREDWDPSVQALAAGFPDLVTRMNDHLDWTEQVGDAVLVQTDEVMDSVQRLRDQAADTGYLTSNDAQTVNVSADNTITIAPANPGIVYVPAYDSNVVYSSPAPPDVVYVDSGNGTDFSDALVTGAIVFGTAMILSNIFDNNDPWDNYWRGPTHVDWHNHDFNPRPNINVNGDINIVNNNKFKNINRDKINNLDRNRTGTRIGGIDRDGIDRNHDRNFKPGGDRRTEAQNKMAARKAEGKRPAELPSAGASRNGGLGTAAGANAGKKADLKPAKVNNKVTRDKAAQPKVNRPSTGAAKVSRSATSKPAASRAPSRSSAFQKSGGSRAGAASARGKSSQGKRRR